MRQFLINPAVEITDAAFLVGYEDPHSFYRALPTWDGTTPPNGARLTGPGKAIWPEK